MTEAKRWSACRNGKCNCGYVHRDGVFALKVVGEGDHVDPYLPETERRDLIRRVTALLNAAEGIPTETLEAGAVVVPVEELRQRLLALIRATVETALSERRRLPAGILDDHLKDLNALTQTTSKMERRLDSFIQWLSRLQQNGGEGR